jgi:cell division cycle 20-like protein 1 (cofactor of APC complex)
LNNADASSPSSPGGDGDNTNDILPAQSFGATLVGGTPVIDETATAGGGGGADATPDVSATFSDDGDQDSTERHDLVHRQPLLYDALLRSEMLGENIDPAARHSLHSGVGMSNYSTSHHGSGALSPFRERSNNLRFVSPYHAMNTVVTYDYDVNRRESEHQSIVGSFNLSPVSSMSRQRVPRFTDRCKRKIAKVPTKVLDAPSLQDDFYLNLVDWSSQNVLAVGLGSCVYLWSAATSKVTQLCDFSETEDVVTSVAWSEGGRHLAVGSSRGEVQLWDASNQKLIRIMGGHSARIGALSWKQSSSGGAPTAGSSSLLASGSRDRLIHLRDPRSDSPYEMRLCAHKQEVCGLKWSFDERSMLASGGNDNKLLVWDIKKHTSPIHSFGDHTAAVKAITWSPHQHGLLASGGGTADRCIRFWNCLTGHGINCIDTGSQVCNLAWSKNCNEIVSTHGYSLNQIVVWKYPSMQKIATLTGHTYRVLYLAVSPDGSTIVTGAGDETLRFWQVFPGPQKENKAGGLLFPAGMPGSVIR